jgi:hypothetical protein
MNSDLIRIWLNRYKSSRIFTKCSAAVFSLFAGIIALIITFALTYFVAWLATSGFLSLVELVVGAKFKVGATWLLIVCSLFIVMLFVQYMRMDSWSWGRYGKKIDMDPRLKSDIGELMPSTKILVHSGTMAKSIADLLVIGPRLMLGFLVCLQELSMIRRIEIDKCSAALAFLYSQPDVVAYEQLFEAGWGKELGQLKNIEGICFLKAGLMLSEELRTEFNNLQ